ncbi:MAG: hypothetical protein APF81_14015 [Desulfosporosinus sp. BRH_c37]|nr:MAG: hypothetical protein APF81_14015 [Desulfosporosinus sp. BRH_c37]
MDNEDRGNRIAHNEEEENNMPSTAKKKPQDHIFFEDNPSEFKIRPILIIEVDPDSALFTIAEITSSQPKIPPTYHDRFKEPTGVELD